MSNSLSNYTEAKAKANAAYKNETQAILADAARIAELRLELIEEMNGLDARYMVHNRMVEFGATLQDRDTLTLSSAEFQCAIAAFDEAHPPIDDLEPRCMECGARENLWDSEECFSCRDLRKAAGREMVDDERYESEVA